MMKTICAACMMMLSIVPSGLATTYPSEGITYVVPAAVGTEADVLARAQAPLLSRLLTWNVSIVNAPGNGGSIGLSDMIRSPADGYKIASFAMHNIALTPLQRRNAGYRTQQINPVMIFAMTPLALVVAKDSPYASVQELLADTNTTLVVGGFGKDTPARLGAKRLMARIGKFITYHETSRTGSLLQALDEHRIDAALIFANAASIHADDVKVLAVAAPTRMSILPDVPTFREYGIDFVDGVHRGLAVPPGTPQYIVTALRKAINTVQADASYQASMQRLGFVLLNINAQQAKAMILKTVQDYNQPAVR